MPTPTEVPIVSKHIVAPDMLKGVLEGCRGVDVEKAVRIRHRDDVMDRLCQDLPEKLRRLMQQCTDNVQGCSRLLLIVRCCERIGDPITDIAESVCYIGAGDFYPARSPAQPLFTN